MTQPFSRNEMMEDDVVLLQLKKYFFEKFL